jgi:acetyl-CoA carboxylase, biotin carboxylase subunit
MQEKVLIPTRGIVALDIINSLNSMGMETLLMHSPEDSLSLPVKLADRSYKFYSSRLEDSYLDMDAIIEKAREVHAASIHPGYGFLAESPQFASLCKDNHIRFIGPESGVLALVEDKIRLRETAAALGLPVLKFSGLIKSPLDFDACSNDCNYPIIIKPLKGSGGRGIRVADYRRDAQEQMANLLKREENVRSGIFFEEFRPYAHHIEIPFFRDVKDNILFLPEIESSVQRRFQKIFQESPSPNVDERLRASIYERSQALLRKIDYVGLGYLEFIVENDECLFSEINPTFQINTLISEVQMTSNFLKKQVVISRGELLHDVHGIKIVKPKHHVLLVSLMAEDPYNNFLPSTGQISHFFHYSTIRNVFKTTLYTGARVTPMYDPFIGKILTYAFERPNAINDMRIFMENIIIRGIRTNLVFLKHLLENAELRKGDTIIDFLHLKFDFSKLKNTEEEAIVAAALLAADFHIDNRKKDYKAKLEKMKQPGFLKRLFSPY